MSLNLPLEEKLVASIDRRRIAEEMRKRRIFNEKQRRIGVDVEALNHQMHENILSRNKQDEIERHFANESRKQDDLAILFDQKEKDEIRELNRKIDEFRLSQQRPEYRRDYDLYDPDQLKREHPPRISDDQPCPISGLQKLEGEDLNYKGRTKKQKEQAREFLLQQMQEKRLKNYMENKETNDWESLLLKQDYNALQMALAEQDNHRKAFEKLHNANKYLAIETTERNMHQKIKEDYEKKKDIENNFYSDLLTENPLVARSAFGSHRVVPDRWKGMSKQQLDEFYDAQKQQIIDNKRKEEHEKYETAVWDDVILKQARTTQCHMEEELTQKTEMEKKLAKMNQQLSAEQKMQQDYLNKIVYSNIPSDNYFAQFNTSSR